MSRLVEHVLKATQADEDRYFPIDLLVGSTTVLCYAALHLITIQI
jgi:hypothetical protein